MTFIEQSRGSPLSNETLTTLSSYLPLNYVAAATKTAILAELIDRVEMKTEDIQAIVNSPVWMQVPQLIKSDNSEIWSLASQVFVLGDESVSVTSNPPSVLVPPPLPTFPHPPRIWRRELSRGIDDALILERQSQKRSELQNLKIILLGPEQSGKTTLIKGLRTVLLQRASTLRCVVRIRVWNQHALFSLAILMTLKFRPSHGDQ
ncbi:hypothetical protein R3P38DRAFT_68973 [Favolaschia claudopus]|uniref:Uncharacterized protein n=1 Tax=Favolaschia claudopus TaxID=2862362 RepID=A0AAW0D3P6_9AGAR